MWFGPDHSRNIPKPTQGRQTNYAAEVQAAEAAAKKSSENGIEKINIFPESKFLIDSYTKYTLTWEANGWKIAHKKPAVNHPYRAP